MLDWAVNKMIFVLQTYGLIIIIFGPCPRKNISPFKPSSLETSSEKNAGSISLLHSLTQKTQIIRSFELLLPVPTHNHRKKNIWRHQTLMNHVQIYFLTSKRSKNRLWHKPCVPYLLQDFSGWSWRKNNVWNVYVNQQVVCIIHLQVHEALLFLWSVYLIFWLSLEMFKFWWASASELVACITSFYAICALSLPHVWAARTPRILSANGWDFIHKFTAHPTNSLISHNFCHGVNGRGGRDSLYFSFKRKQ